MKIQNKKNSQKKRETDFENQFPYFYLRKPKQWRHWKIQLAKPSKPDIEDRSKGK